MKNACNASHKNKRIFSQKRGILILFQKYRFVALFGFLFGIILYSLMMSQQLTNTFDGLWQQNYHRADRLELTSGRWFLILVDKLLMGLHADPIASIAALIMFIVGFLLVLDLFEANNNLCNCLCIALFISSTAISSTLSYRFTSFGYALAYLFATLSVYSAIIIHKNSIAIAVSGLFLGLSISCYQAYLSVFCIVAVFYIISMCNKKENDEHSIIQTLIRMLCALFIGAVFYIVLLSLFLRGYHTSLSGYNGIGNVSLGGFLAGLPHSVLKTYQYFAAYFFMDELKLNRLQSFGIFYLLLALLIVSVVYIGIRVWKAKKGRTVALLFAAIMIPVASNSYMLIAGDKLECQMAAGLAMLAPLIMIVAFSCFRQKRFLQTACTVFCIVLLLGSTTQVWCDQEAMYEGRNACETMATQVIADLKNDDLLSSDYEYFFVGVPAESPYFSVSDAFYHANGYAQMGNFWVAGDCNQMSYSGLIQKYMGFNLPMSYQSYTTIEKEMNLSEMPSFPEDGYIASLDDHTVVIKISEYKEYTGHSKYVIE